MADKIIIDGIDVSECPYYIDKDGTCSSHDCECIKCIHNNCFYKDYKQVKREYEELRRKHNEDCKEFKQEINLRIEDYNKLSRDFYSGEYCNTQYCEQLKRKEQECEELKKQHEQYKPFYELGAKCTQLNEVADGLSNKCDKYKQALDEIEGLVKNFCEDCSEYERCDYEKDGCYYSILPRLKDIIKKVKEEKC